MNKLIPIGLLASLTVTSVALPSAANTPQQNPSTLLAQREPGAGKDARWMESLNLSSQQKQELNAIRQKYQGQMDKAFNQLRDRQDELQKLMSGNASDQDIRAKHKQVSELRSQLGELRFESMLESRKVLTPEQRKQFAQLMDERRERKSMGRSGGNR